MKNTLIKGLRLQAEQERIKNAGVELYQALKELLDNQGYDGRYPDGVGYRSDEQQLARINAEKAIAKAEGK